MFFYIALIFAITFFVCFWHSIRLETSGIADLTTSSIQHTIIIVVNQSHFYFPVVVSSTSWARYNEALLHCLVNLENIVLLIVIFLEGHSNSRAICTVTFWYGCKLYTFDIICFYFPFKIH